jgi:hypothetical protein
MLGVREVRRDQPASRSRAQPLRTRQPGEHREGLEGGVAGQAELTTCQRREGRVVLLVVAEDQRDPGAGVE